MLSYDELTPPERELWDAFPKGRRVELRTGMPEADEPATGGQWGPERSVRAAVVKALLLGANDQRSGAVAALRLAGARITGRLDLSGAEICHTFSLEGCRLEQAMGLHGATTRTIRITNSWVPGIGAELVRIEGDLDLRRSALEGGSLILINARMAGNLHLADARISGPTVAVRASGLVMEAASSANDLSRRAGCGCLAPSCPGACFCRARGWRTPAASHSPQAMCPPRLWTVPTGSPRRGAYGCEGLA